MIKKTGIYLLHWPIIIIDWCWR